MCTLWSLALAKKSCNNINNSRTQVSRLCWLWCNRVLAIVWKVTSAKSPCKLLCKRNNILKRFEISNRFEFTSGIRGAALIFRTLYHGYSIAYRDCMKFLPTNIWPEVEFFVIVGISKVMFCTLMILYTLILSFLCVV